MLRHVMWGDLAVSAMRTLVERLTDDHPDAAVRETARQRLPVLEPEETGGLDVLSATHGAGEQVVNVTAELRLRVVTRGRLTFKATDILFGDPAVGVTKDLLVERTFGGRTWIRTVRAGATLVIP